MKIDIVVVNWNSGPLLQECVESILKFGRPLVARTVVVDNNSSDESHKFMVDLPNTTLIQAPTNLGFGKACNLGAKICDGDYILFLNPDSRLYQHTLEDVLEFMSRERNSSIGICGVRLEDEHGETARSCSRFPSVKGFLSKAIGLTRLAPSFGSAMNEWDHSHSRKVDQVIGAFFFVRKNLFDSLNGFDERFFVYFEEVDFAYRAKQVGLSNYYLAETAAFHLGGGVSRHVKSRRLFYSMRSRIQYAIKNFDSKDAYLVIFITLIIEPFTRIILSLFTLSTTSLKESISAFLKLYVWSFNSLLRGNL